jgi:catechol 2,3-dioxygenase-like lactoylglutathione lyase family enzyme
MLGTCPVDVMLLATDLGVARSFYEGTLGLEVLVAAEQFLTFGCGGDSRLVVTHSTTGTRVDPDHNWIGLLQLKDLAVRPRGAATGTGQADRSDLPGSQVQAT